jgi:hypothetical protein
MAWSLVGRYYFSVENIAFIFMADVKTEGGPSSETFITTYQTTRCQSQRIINMNLELFQYKNLFG